MIRTIIIEDEQDSMNLLCNLLQEFKNIEIIAVATNITEAAEVLETLHPDLVFSDIELGEAAIFDMLQQLTTINFEIIFTTAFEKYALQAIKFSALDYLLKPFGKEDLSEAIHHYLQKQTKQSFQQFETLFHNLKHYQTDSKKIVLPTSAGLTIVQVKDVIYCQAEINYTLFFFADKKKMLVTKTLKEFEELLNDYDFIRVHNSHLINLHHVKNFIRAEGGSVTMSDGSVIDVSRRKKDELLKRLSSL